MNGEQLEYIIINERLYCLHLDEDTFIAKIEEVPFVKIQENDAKMLCDYLSNKMHDKSELLLRRSHYDGYYSIRAFNDYGSSIYDQPLTYDLNSNSNYSYFIKVRSKILNMHDHSLMLSILFHISSNGYQLTYEKQYLNGLWQTYWRREILIKENTSIEQMLIEMELNK